MLPTKLSICYNKDSLFQSQEYFTAKWIYFLIWMIDKGVLVDHVKRKFEPLPNDDELDSNKTNRILGKLKDHIPNAVAILSWQEEMKSHNVPQNDSHPTIDNVIPR